MPYIDVVDEDKAQDELFDIYDELQRTRGRVSNVMRVQSLHPKGMRKHLELYMEMLYGKGPLDRLQRELIGVVCSAANGCEYCVVHHADALQKYAKDKVWVARVRNDYLDAELTPQQRALADFARSLTLEPGKGGKERVESLRKAGFKDDAILHAAEVVGYFNFVNRLVHGLGVELEEDPHQDFLY